MHSSCKQFLKWMYKIIWTCPNAICLKHFCDRFLTTILIVCSTRAKHVAKTHNRIASQLPTLFPIEASFIERWPQCIWLSYSVHFQLLQLCCTSYQNENLKIALIDTLSYVIIEVIDYHLLLYKYFTAAQKTHHNGIDNIAVVVFQSFDSLWNNNKQRRKCCYQWQSWVYW